MERSRVHGEAPEKRSWQKPAARDRLSERLDRRVTDLTDRYYAVIENSFPCEGHISELTRQAARLRIQLQKIRAARETPE